MSCLGGYREIRAARVDGGVAPETTAEQQLAAVRTIQKCFRLHAQLLADAKKVEEKAQEDYLEKDELQDYGLQLVRFFMHPVSHVRDPGQYLGMSSELFALVTIVCFSMTRIIHPEVFTNNPLLEAWGYNNICVAFDLQPMRNIAAVGWTSIVYCTVEFAKLVTHRIALERKQKRLVGAGHGLARFFVFCHVGFALSTATFMLCFMIPPTDSRTWHTRPFEGYIFFKVLSTWAIIKEYSLEKDPRVKRLLKPSTWVYIYGYGILSFYLVTTAELTYHHHQTNPDAGPLLPWRLSMAADWSWIFLNVIGGNFLPQPPLMVDGHVVHPETLQSMHRRFGSEHHHKPRPRKGKGHPLCCGAALHAIDDIDLKPHELAHGKDDPAIPEVAEIFRKLNRESLQKQPTLTNEPRCGLTVTVMKAKLVIDERIQSLPPWQRHGLFKEPGTYDAIVRINVTEHGAARFSIRLDVPESMEVLDECETARTAGGMRQVDLLLAEGFEQFFVPTPAALKHIMGVALEPGFKTLFAGKISDLVRGIKGFMRAKDNLDNTQGVCGKAYYSGTPFQLGRCVCKFGLQPKQADPLKPDEIPCGKAKANLTDNEEEVAAKYAAAMVRKIKDKTETDGFKWDFVMQLGKRHPSHSLQEGDVQWDSKISPYRAMGTFTVFPEPGFGGGIAGQSGPPLYFNPWNMLKAHRPVGALNHARLHAYKGHQEARRQAGGGLQPDKVCPYLASLGVA